MSGQPAAQAPAPAPAAAAAASAGGPSPVTSQVTRTYRRADGSIATVTTTTVTTITPPDEGHDPRVAVAPYAVHRQGTLWRVAPRHGGDAVFAHLDLHQVGVAPALAEQAMAGHATLLLEGRLFRSHHGRGATLLATGVEGGVPDPGRLR